MVIADLIPEFRMRIRDLPGRPRARYLEDFVFVHINKTGGTSIEQALKLQTRHRTALELRKKLGAHAWEHCFSFAFVRDPWDKVASHYAYRVATNQTGLQDAPIDFNDWVRLAYGEHEPRYYDNPKMFMPQTDWISDESGSRMVSFVGRFEHLSADFRVVCERIGRRLELPHVKKSNSRDYRRQFNAASVEIVAERFRCDIEEFGYSFD